MAELGKFQYHIPEKILANNPSLQRFVRVLDGMVARKDLMVEKYAASYDPRLAEDIQTLRYYVDEFGGEYRGDHPKKCLECLYLNKWDIYARKGTKIGLVRWLECITAGKVTRLVYKAGAPYIHFFNLNGGILPNGKDLQRELDPEFADENFLIPTLIGGSWLSSYSKFELTIDNPYNITADFRDWLLRVLPKYLPVSDPRTMYLLITFTVEGVAVNLAPPAGDIALPAGTPPAGGKVII